MDLPGEESVVALYMDHWQQVLALLVVHYTDLKNEIVGKVVLEYRCHLWERVKVMSEVLELMADV